ncbi:recombination protein RecR [Candidatus Desantisbacteria bacterium]|nr:recombination protein RecR [Candidatus Desantisbacteria bacterium]
MQNAASLEKLIKELKKMPGVGTRSAERLAFYILKIPLEQAENLREAIKDVKEKISFCEKCFSITEISPCNICRDVKRDSSLLCVVEDPRDLIAIEKTGAFRGIYHVLLGHLSPLKGINPDNIKIKELLIRLTNSPVREIILATNHNTEGEATAIYLTQLIKPLNIKITRLASGVPMGGDLEYIDELTLGKAMEGRREIS